VREKINKLSPAGKNTKREELYNKLNQVRDQQKELKDSKKAVLTQLDAIQQSMKKKVLQGFLFIIAIRCFRCFHQLA
jgi:hypothetical protein